MTIVTRFAPSPSGYLHIGGARTALFNWLFARHHKGKFLLRIEDTDRARSTPEAIDAILKGMDWLGLDYDEEPRYQSSHAERHRMVVQELLNKGMAYKCYTSADELAQMRAAAEAEGKAFRYDRRWRDKDANDAPKDAVYVVRIKAPLEGEMLIKDLIQGEVRVPCSELDDMILLRADGTPTYMLAVVVDDHDQQVSHVIRGDDHLNNAFRQTVIYEAMGWTTPCFAHIPLIHGQDGKKLSKRQGALGIDWYHTQGYLPEAMRNYLLRLGWAHGDDEIIPTQKAIEWFDLSHIGKGAARFDMEKLNHINAHYLKECEDVWLTTQLMTQLEAKEITPSDLQKAWIAQGMKDLKQRVKILSELVEVSSFYYNPLPLSLDEKAKKALSGDGLLVLSGLKELISVQEIWEEEALKDSFKAFAKEKNLKTGQVFQPLRAALTGSMASPGVVEVLLVIGPKEAMRRIDSCLD